MPVVRELRHQSFEHVNLGLGTRSTQPFWEKMFNVHLIGCHEGMYPGHSTVPTSSCSHVQGTGPLDQVGKSHHGIFLNKINYKANRDINVGVGAVYASNHGKPMIIPALTFVYSQPHYLINIDFPVKAEVEGIFGGGKWRPVMGVSFPSNAYHVKSSDHYFSTSGIVGYVGTSYRILDFLYAHAKWQTGLGETVKVGSRDEREKIGMIRGQGQFVVSLSIQMARNIPDGGR